MHTCIHICIHMRKASIQSFALALALLNKVALAMWMQVNASNLTTTQSNFVSILKCDCCKAICCYALSLEEFANKEASGSSTHDSIHIGVRNENTVLRVSSQMPVVNLQRTRTGISFLYTATCYIEAVNYFISYLKLLLMLSAFRRTT